MKAEAYRVLRRVPGFAPLLLTGCERAPAFDVLGSLFPAWLICCGVAILLAAMCRALLQHLVEIAFPALRTLNWVHLASRYPVRVRVENPTSDLFRLGESAVVAIRGR